MELSESQETAGLAVAVWRVAGEECETPKLAPDILIEDEELFGELLGARWLIDMRSKDRRASAEAVAIKLVMTRLCSPSSPDKGFRVKEDVDSHMVKAEAVGRTRLLTDESEGPKPSPKAVRCAGLRISVFGLDMLKTS